jgi:acetoin utilization deacetylase AcuC-like enzyme
MLPFKLIYHEDYDLHLGAHVFPTEKFRLIRDRLLSDGFAEEADFVAPERASDEDLALVHTADWVTRLRGGRLRFEEVLRLEIPYSQEMVNAFWLAAGGSTLAAQMALRDGIAYNVGGGFHHAFPGHGEGFCAIHDVAVAIRRLQKDGLIGKAMVVDCDVHQGNGTAAIFANDPSVFTLSIHQYNNYPYEKPPSDIDIDLEDEVGDEEYLARFREAYLPAMERFRPDLLMYVAGADPYFDDQLGGLALTMEGLLNRDRLVLGTAVKERVPAAVTLAGGYARILDDTVAIQSGTAKVCLEVLKSS